MKKAEGTGFITDKKDEYLYTFYDDKIYQYKLPELTLIHTFQGIPEILKIALSEKEEKMAVTDTKGTVAVIDLSNGKLLGQNVMEDSEENFVAFIEDDAYVLCADQNGKVMRLDCTDFSSEVLYDFGNEETEDIVQVLFDPYRNQLIAMEYGTENMYVSDYREISFEKKELDGISGCFSDVSDWFFIGKKCYLNLTEDGELIFFDQQKRWNVMELHGNTPCSCFCISEDGNYLLVAEGKLLRKEKVKVIHLREQKTVAEWKFRWIDSAKFVRNNQYVLIAAYNGVYIKKI